MNSVSRPDPPAEPASALEARLRAALAGARAADAYRTRRARPPVPAGRDFHSNDYLDLARHPRVRAALAEGAARWGAGSTGSSVVCGYTDAHEALERALAAFTGRESALVFPSGYAANLAVLSALARRGDTIVADRLNHASLNDGALLSRARLRRYPHADAAAAERALANAAGETLLVTDGVFSMDGDLAPLPALAAAAARRNAALVVDDAHGIGVLGAGGAGTLARYGLDAAAVPVLIGTFGKALGGQGAFVAGSRMLVEALVQQARPYLYGTALAPALAEAARAALALTGAEPWRRAHLHARIARFRDAAASAGVPLLPSDTPIQPVVLGASGTALRVAGALEQAGFAVTAIRPPTVPAGSARLRITLGVRHRDADVDALVSALARARAEHGR